MSASNWKHEEVAMVTVITHIPLKPPQAVFTIYSSARSKDLSEGTSSSKCEEREKKGCDPKRGLSQILFV